MDSLGNALKTYRQLNHFTLRQVEEATGISNAYLSQLENDKIKKPSADVLYKLSRIYRVSLENLLSFAGILTEKTNHQTSGSDIFGHLTAEEEKQILQYLNFLRFSK